MTMVPLSRTLLALSAVLLSGCAVGPDYQRPDVAEPDSYKATLAEPAGSGKLPRGWILASEAERVAGDPWWQNFDDPVLAELLAAVAVDNQQLAAAEARYRQALALIGSARADLLPGLDASAGYSRSGVGKGDSSSGNEFVGNTTRRGGSQYNLSLNVGWELDLWGRIRRQLESREADAMATAAELAALRLSLQSTLAQSYFQLRVVDEQQRLLDATLEAYERSVELTNNQYRAGIAARSDVLQALTQLETTRAEAVDLARQRRQLENAIAVLTGKPPAALQLEPRPFQFALPETPVGLPSELLLRRPDILAAERAVASANAQIGVARSAWFPTLTLSASGGYQNDRVTSLLELPNRFWSIGPTLTLPLFDGGTRRAESRRVEAAYDEQVANYRQTVLNAFEEVENALMQLDVLSRSAEVRRRAVELAEEAERLVTNQYRAGRVSFLEVISAQATTLANRRSLLDLTADRLVASVQLITALGGDWQTPTTVAARDKD